MSNPVVRITCLCGTHERCRGIIRRGNLESWPALYDCAGVHLKNRTLTMNRHGGEKGGFATSSLVELERVKETVTLVLEKRKRDCKTADSRKSE